MAWAVRDWRVRGRALDHSRTGRDRRWRHTAQPDELRERNRRMWSGVSPTHRGGALERGQSGVARSIAGRLRGPHATWCPHRSNYLARRGRLLWRPRFELLSVRATGSRPGARRRRASAARREGRQGTHRRRAVATAQAGLTASLARAYSAIISRTVVSN